MNKNSIKFIIFIILIMIIINCECLGNESYDNENPIKARINCNDTGITYSMLEFNSSESSSEKGEIYRWIWDFGDGEIIQGENVKHMYMKDGTYEIRLTVEDNHGKKDTTTKKIEIIHFLRVEIHIRDNEYLCTGDINLSVKIYNYAFDDTDITNYSFKNGNQVIYLTNPTGNTSILSNYNSHVDSSTYNSSKSKPKFIYNRNYNLTKFNHRFGFSNYHLNLIGEYKLLMGIQTNYKGSNFEIISNEVSFSIYSNDQVPVTLFENTLVYLENSEYYSEFNTTYKQDLIIYNLSTNQIIMKISSFDDWIIHPYGSIYGNYFTFPLYNNTIENKQIYLVNITNKTLVKLSDTSKSFPVIYKNEVIWIYNSSHYMIYYINNETWFFKNIAKVKNPFENFSSYIQYNRKYLVGINSPGEFDYRRDRFLHIFDLQNNKEHFIIVQKTWISEFYLYGNYLSWCDDQNWYLRKNNTSIDSNYDVFLYDILSNTTHQITGNKFDQGYEHFFTGFSFYGNYIAWTDYRNPIEDDDLFLVDHDIYIFDIIASKEIPVLIDPYTSTNPIVYENNMVLIDFRNNIDNSLYYRRADVYFIDLNTLEMRRVTN